MNAIKKILAVFSGSYIRCGVIIFCLVVFQSEVLHAQKNRYGMLLEGDANAYRLRDSAKICPLVEGGCATLPADAWQAMPAYKPGLIQPADYKQCYTLQFVYKKYDTLNLFMEVDPPVGSKGPYPFVIWVHGGGWANGNQTLFRNQSTYLASRGIAGVRISYSLMSQGGTFNKGMQEMAAAYEFVKAHAADWGLDMSRFGYAGGSAGTPLASLAAMQHNGNGAKLFMGCNGIYDFTNNLQGTFGRTSPYLKEYPDKDSRTAISAIHHIPDDAKNIPALAVFHGTADFTISHWQSVALCDAVAAKGGRSEKYIYPNYVHAFYAMGSSDVYEDITMKMYAFAKSVFNLRD